MTENEKRLDELKNAIIEMVSISEDAVMEKDFQELDNAGVEIIKRLDEVEAYRAIGTVEECQQRKDYIDTINALLKDLLYTAYGTENTLRI